MWLFYINDKKLEVSDEDRLKLIDAFDWETSTYTDDYYHCEFADIKLALIKKITVNNPYENFEFIYR